MADGLAWALSRGKVISVDDAGDYQKIVLTGYRGERFSDVIRAQPHGFSSSPPADAVGHLLRMGDSARAVALGFETAGRPRSLSPGGAVLYDATGNRIDVAGTSGIKLNAGTREMKLTADGFAFESDGGGPATIRVGNLTIEVTGTLTITSPDTRIGAAGSGMAAVQTVSGPSPHLKASV